MTSSTVTRPISAWAPVCVAAWLAVALALYAPSAARPFDIVDFPQFLPLLKAHASPWSQFRAIADFYATEGRMSLLAYAFLVLKWNLFGSWVLGWQMLRFGEMLVIAALLYTLLRRWGISALGAYCASTLVLCAQGPAIAWIRLNMSEPFGLVLLLAALHLATRTPRVVGWPAFALLGVLATASLLMKEMHLATFPAILWGYAAFDGNGSPRPLTIDRRVWLAAATLTVVAAIVLIPAAHIALSAPQQAYSRDFGEATWSPTNQLFSLLAIVVPFPLILTNANPLLYVGILLYLALLVAGAQAYVSTAADTRLARNLLLLGAAFPLCGSLAYAPWPNFSLLYGIPYVLAPALMLGAGVTGLQRLLGRRARLLTVAFVFVLAPMVANASAYSQRVDSYLRLSDAIVRYANVLPKERPLMVATCDLPLEPWPTLGFYLFRFGRAMDLELPSFHDVGCPDAERILHAPSRDSAVVIVTEDLRNVPAGATLLRRGAWSIAYPQIRPHWNEVSAIALPASR